MTGLEDKYLEIIVSSAYYFGLRELASLFGVSGAPGKNCRQALLLQTVPCIAQNERRHVCEQPENEASNEEMRLLWRDQELCVDSHVKVESHVIGPKYL